MSPLNVFISQEGESWLSVLKRVAGSPDDALLIIGGLETVLENNAAELHAFLQQAASLSNRLLLATRRKHIVSAARGKGIRVVDRSADLEELLREHPMLPEALRVFSPHRWQQQLRSRLQSMGLLALPRWRIWVLMGVSGILFLFVLFKLLPSADIRVWPREDTVSQTANIFLVLSGATLQAPPRVRTMELKPIRVEMTRTLTYDQITKDFVGKHAYGTVTVVNRSAESYSLRSKTRIANNAGMIFVTLEPLILAPGEEMTVRVESADVDLYGEIIGERGNLPAGLRWDFLGLAPEERTLVYGENREALSGGQTSFRTVLHEQDLLAAQKTLEQELLASAKQLIDEEKTLRNTQDSSAHLEILYYDELTTVDFHDFKLPREFLGQAVTSIPIQGSLTYTAYAYDGQLVLEMLHKELSDHVTEGRVLLPETVSLDRLVTHVIDYADDLSWIKLTVDLSGTEQNVLDPLTPNGARFDKRVREMVTGISQEDALRILRNLPEVERAEIHIWPPWSSTLPRIPSHISISPLQRSSSDL